ncbi:MAG: fasciclin domain-containing protein, partial [Candidatus Thermoplasmatota archaeon]|nr:fasciclin domain-containing protein [Candidatus Thermoplasmatota archaeon]
MIKIKTNKIISIILVFVLTISVVTLTGCFEEETEEEPKNIVETAKEHDDFNTLVDALTDADLVSVLSNEDEQFTVFAPTDAAFSKLGDTYVTDLVENDVANLTKILLYHVLEGKVMATDLSDEMKTETVQGKYIDISIEDDTVYINDAKVTTADIECSNGVIHVIDTVLVPKKNIVETAIEYNFDILVEVVVAADLDDTLTDESADYTVFAPTDEAFNELNTTYLNNLINNDTANLTSILTYHVSS